MIDYADPQPARTWDEDQQLNADLKAENERYRRRENCTDFDGWLSEDLECDREDVACYIHLLEYERVRVKALTPYPLCLNCGASKPCFLDKEETSGALPSNGIWPGSPCTFDPTPQQMWDKNRELQAENERLREALREIAEMASNPNGPPTRVAHWLASIQRAARRALGEEVQG